MNRICPAGTPAWISPARILPYTWEPAAGFGVPRSQNTIWNPPPGRGRVIAGQDQVAGGVVDPGHVAR